MKLEFIITEKSDFSREVIFVIHFAVQKKRSQLSPDEVGYGITALKFCLFSLVDPCPVGRNHLHPFGAIPKHEGVKGCKGFRCWVLQGGFCTIEVAPGGSALVQR